VFSELLNYVDTFYLLMSHK